MKQLASRFSLETTFGSFRFLNREISQLAFIRRVLKEARNKHLTVFQRIKFLSICASTIDEFCAVRLANLMFERYIIPYDILRDGLTLSTQLIQAQLGVAQLKKKQQKLWKQLQKELAQKKFRLVTKASFSHDDFSFLKEKHTALFQTICETTLITSSLPILKNQRSDFIFCIMLEKNEDKTQHYAHLTLPNGAPKMFSLPTVEKKTRYVFIETVLPFILKAPLKPFTPLYHFTLKSIRDSEIGLFDHTETTPPLNTMKQALANRSSNPLVYLETSLPTPTPLLNQLLEELMLSKAHSFTHPHLIDLSRLNSLIATPLSAHKPSTRLHTDPFQKNCFDTLKKNDVLIHHPYENFDKVLSFIEQASLDPHTTSIMQTIYRTDENSKLFELLKNAVQHGKKVTLLIELKARFDEEKNIALANDLENAGIQICYGFHDLKVHTKMCLVERKINSTYEAFAHIGTGNYHPITANLYQDVSLLTASPEICNDIKRIFDFILHHTAPPSLTSVSISPIKLRSTLLELIDNEITLAREGARGEIMLKCNALIDSEMIDKLYEASRAGVIITLFIRGICCLRPGVPGLSKTITVKSLIGNFLEHSRIYCFGNGYPIPSSHARVFISSSDLMTRNLDRRVEVLLPITTPRISDALQTILLANARDVQQSWYLQKNGTYQRTQSTKKKRSSYFSVHKHFKTLNACEEVE